VDEDVFNMQLRKFLKTVGVTSQREIENTIRGAIAEGTLAGNETIKAKVILSIEGLGLSKEIEGDIDLS